MLLLILFLLTTTPEVALQDTGCKMDWYSFADYCYFIHAREFKYKQSIQECVTLDATLTSINSEDENTFIESIFDQISNTQSVWIGYNDIEEEGTFSWIDGSNTAYTHWDPDAPENTDNKDCVVVRSDGYWRVRNGNNNNQKRRPLCRTRKAVPLPTTPPLTSSATTTASVIPINPTTTTTTTRSSTLPPTTESYQTNQPNTTRSPTTSRKTSGSTAAAGPHDPQQGGPPIASIIGATVGSLLALVLLVLLVLIFTKKKRNNNKPQNSKPVSATTPMAFVGPYDLTIDNIDSQHASSINQPVYSDTDLAHESSSKTYPIYANTNPSDPSSDEVYHEVPETSTDADYITVYSTLDNNISDSKSKGNHNSIPGSGVYNKATNMEEGSLYCAISDSCQDAAGSKQPPEFNGDDNDDEEGWEANIAYSGFQSDDQKGHEHSDKDRPTEGWEDNALYSTANANDEEIVEVVEATDNNEEVWEVNALYSTANTNQEVVNVVEATDKNKEGWEENALYGLSEEVGSVGGGNINSVDGNDRSVEGWEDNVLYATRSVETDGGVDVEDEGWEDNVIYAGSDDEE